MPRRKENAKENKRKDVDVGEVGKETQGGKENSGRWAGIATDNLPRPIPSL